MRAVCLFAAFHAVCAASVYPSEYPFANQKVKPPELPSALPFDTNTTFDLPNNPGGYLNYFNKCDPYSSDRSAFKLGLLPSDQDTAGFFECRGQAWSRWTRTKQPYGHPTKNCTGKLEYSPSLVSGKVNDVQYCKDGSNCCPQLKGALSPRNSAATNEEKLGDLAKNGGCKAMDSKISEPVFCQWIWMGYNCQEYFIKGKANDRRWTIPCQDVFWMWVMNDCKLFSDPKVFLEWDTFLDGFEPAQYFTGLTAGQVHRMMPTFRMIDRVCHPYSYYHPSSEPGGGGSAGSTTGQAIAASVLPVVLSLSMVAA